MLGMPLFRLHAIKSNSEMKKYLSKNDFAYMLAKQDGYLDKLPRWIWWVP